MQPITCTRHLLIIGILATVMLTACPGKREPRHPAGTPSQPTTETPAPPHRRPSTPPWGEAQAAEYQAAEALVADGQIAEAAGDLNLAESQFRQALQIAPHYGPAYYWLAVVKIDMGEPQAAAGLLDRAETLLGTDPDWLEHITALRQVMTNP